MKKMPFSKSIRILLAVDGLILMAAAMLGPIYALFVENIGGSLLDASLAGGVFALAAGITTFISGRYADKIKENELILVFGYALKGMGFLLYMFVNSIWFLLFVQVLIGFSEAIHSPAFDALFSRHAARKKLGRAWGTWEATNYFSAAFGAVLGGVIVVNFGFNSLFVVMALLCFSSALYIYRLPRSML